MRDIKFFLTSFLLVNFAYADTKPMHFDVGDIEPRQKITVDVNPQKWSGFLDIKCDIIDPSHSAIMRISYNNSVEIVKINEDKYDQYQMPFQISLKAQQNKLTLFKSLVYGLWSDDITFQNLDDDITISVKNCEASPNAILSKDLIYLPSAIQCFNNHCEMQGSSPENWNDFTASEGAYYFSNVYISYDDNVAATYYNQTNTSSIRLTPKNKLEPFRDIYTAWQGGTAGTPIQCGMDVIKCPLTKTN